MKAFRFSFKSEPIWMLLFSFGAAVLGLLVLLVAWLLRSMR
jgi:hypothetical protein